MTASRRVRVLDFGVFKSVSQGILQPTLPQRTSAPLRARPQPPVPATAHLLLPERPTCELLLLMGNCFKERPLTGTSPKSCLESESRLAMEGCIARELGTRLSRVKCCSGWKAGFLLD